MNDKFRYCVIREKKTDYFFKYINDSNLYNLYKNYKNTVFFRICRKLKLFLLPIFFDSWKKMINNYDYFIIFDSFYFPYIARYIKKKNSNCKIVLYFWNKIDEYRSTFLNDKNVDEFWTFDINDSKKYGINYNKQFYTKELKVENSKIDTDVLFLGRAKNRIDKIINFKNELDNFNIKTDFRIIESEKDYISYDSYLHLLSTSKCILDIVDGEQVGLSLRCMESIFFEKKLITNNSDILNYDFYDSNNIFIVGVDDISRINDFISNDYKKIDDSIINNYDYNEWLKKFFGGKNDV